QAQDARLVRADPDLDRVRGRRAGVEAADRGLAAVEADRPLPAPAEPDDLDRLLEGLEPPATPPRRPAHRRHRLPLRTRAQTELERSNPMTDAVIDEIDGRMIRSGDRWLADFASCNYLGFDLDRQIIESVAPALERWGTHPSWSRLLGSPVLYEEIEARL